VKFKGVIERDIGEVQGEGNIAGKYRKLVGLIRRAALLATPDRVIRGDDRVPWMTREIGESRMERNRLRRDMGARRVEWVGKCAEVDRLSKEAQRRVWRQSMERWRRRRI
jgi:hypothetical protein